MGATEWQTELLFVSKDEAESPFRLSQLYENFQHFFKTWDKIRGLGRNEYIETKPQYRFISGDAPETTNTSRHNTMNLVHDTLDSHRPPKAVELKKFNSVKLLLIKLFLLH